jgi:Ca2+-binding RTX toxin-like protein
MTDVKEFANNSPEAVDVLSELPPEVAANPEVEQILIEKGNTPVSRPDVTVGDFSSTVGKEVIPDAIETQGLGSFNDQLQLQLGEVLSTQDPLGLTPDLATGIPALNTLATFEASAASIASSTPVVIVGDTNNNVLVGTNGADLIFGLEGADTVIALAGDDYVDGGAGNDIIVGGADNDFLVGDAGNDVIYGDSVAALTFGVEGNDNIDGGDGNDTIFAGGGDDFVSGGNGSDRINGDLGNDILNGDADNDFIRGGLGDDSLFGGEGNDFLFGNEGNDSINADSGDDAAFGNDGNDTVFGGFGNDQLYGGVGDDQVIGGVGNDTLLGDEGNDTLIGVDSANAAFGFGKGEIDNMTGGAGKDRFLLGQQGQRFYDDGNAFDTGRSDYGLIKDFESNGTDKIQLSGNANQYVLREVGGDLPQGVGIFTASKFEFPRDPIQPIEPIGPMEPSPELLDDSMNPSLGASFKPVLEETIIRPRPIGGGELIGVVANSSTAQLSLSNVNQFEFV